MRSHRKQGNNNYKYTKSQAVEKRDITNIRVKKEYLREDTAKVYIIWFIDEKYQHSHKNVNSEIRKVIIVNDVILYKSK